MFQCFVAAGQGLCLEGKREAVPSTLNVYQSDVAELDVLGRLIQEGLVEE